MPIYEYECDRCEHRREMMRPIPWRDDIAPCPECTDGIMRLVPSVPAKRTDGIYSYAPNIGSEEAFERKAQKIRERDER